MSIKHFSQLGLAGRTFSQSASVPNVSTTEWVRNPSWLALPTVNIGDNKFVGLHRINPESNFCSLSAAGNYTVDWGDGTTPENYATGVQCYHEFDYTAAGLNGTDAPVTLTDAGDLVTRTAHGYTDGMQVAFYNIVATTGIVATQTYFVINATANTFQVSATSGGAALVLTTDGTATLLPYKLAVVTVTPQAGQTFTALNLYLKHNKAGLNAYATGWLDIAVEGGSLSTLTIGSSGITIRHSNLERANIVRCSVAAFTHLFGNCYSLRSVVDVNTTVAANVNMSYMFYNCHSLQTIPLLNTAACTTMNYMFFYCNSLQTIPLLNTSACTNMSNMFYFCYSLQTIPLLNTSACTNMSNMFYFCYSLQTIPLLNTAACTNMNYMFYFCTSLQTIPLLNTAACMSMSNMFYDCHSLQTIPLLNTAACTSMSNMFYDCYSLQTIPLLNTSACTNMSNMFYFCYSLQTIPLLNTAACTSMNYMLYGCYTLQTIPLLNTSACTDMSYMFYNCHSLQTIPLLNTAACTSMNYMFYFCTSLQTIPLLNTAACTNTSCMFYCCYGLQTIPGINCAAVISYTNFASMFAGCTSLSKIEATGFRFTFSVTGCNLSSAALNLLYTNLPTVTAQTLTVTTNHGNAADDPTIATAKGWTITG